VLILLLIFAGILFAVNFYVDLAITKFTGYIKIASGLFLILTVISTIFYFVKRTPKTFKSSLLITIVFLLLNLVLVTEIIVLEIQGAKLYKLEKQLETCEKARNQFRIDLADGTLKYFTFGIGEDEEFTKKLEDRYGLQVYHMGCIVNASFECYNSLVEQEIKMLDSLNVTR
jgi:hypothetical protein